jgi:hypothetical protein
MKTSGSYASLIRGVSQQAPEVRISGQHTEQINMVPDPIAGLSRRKGTVHLASSAVSSGASAAAVLSTYGGYRTIEHTAKGKEYIILMRDTPSGQTPAMSMAPVECYCVTDNVWLTVYWRGADALGASLLSTNGISAAVSLGQYLLFGVTGLACASTSTPAYDPTSATTSKAVVWIRGGAYNRTYTIKYGASTQSYTTPDAAAGGAAAAITPAAIAANLATLVGGTAVGSHLTFFVAGASDIAVHDGGDGSLMRGVKNVVDDVTKLPIQGIDGQIVKVQTSPTSWFYMKAFGKVAGVTGLQEVIWRECAGEAQAATLTGLGKARIVSSTESASPGLYIGIQQTGNASGLVHMPAVAEAIPSVVASSAGDKSTNIAMRWMSNQITYMGLFQDRLLIGSDAALAVSGAGDYLNFFRTTMVTVPIKDGFEMVAQGGEDDRLRHSVAYNRNLVIFGDKRQYIISGTTALTPTSANMAIMTVYPDGAECRPVAAGGQIYYARNREGAVEVHQIQPGAYVDSAESFPASAQVGNYITAPAAEIETIPGTPAMLVLRSRVTPSTLYVFSYLDAPDGRKQDAWYKWTFDPRCGNVLGVSNTSKGLLLFWVRQLGTGGLVKVADLMPLSTAPATQPYLDSQRDATRTPGDGVVVGDEGWKLAYNAASPTGRFLIGCDYDNATDVAELNAAYPTEGAYQRIGLPFASEVVLTNPYTRDKEDKAVLTGRTVVTKVSVNTKGSSGVAWSLTSGGVTSDKEFNGRRLGDMLNSIGKVPVSSSVVGVPVGRETRAYTLTLKARKWFPLNIIGIEWTGQSFNRTPRA